MPKGSHGRVEAALSQCRQEQREVALGPADAERRIETEDSRQLAAS
jgi:hypothetical protein